MTLAEVTNQIISLSVKRNINGEKRSSDWVKTYITKMVGDEDEKEVYMTILLPDGEWLFSVDYCSGEWGYYIPDTREQECRLFEILTHRF